MPPAEDLMSNHADSHTSSALEAGARPWIGVDVDGTACMYVNYRLQGGMFGPPIPAMWERIRRWLASGKYDVKLFTARASVDYPGRDAEFAQLRRICVEQCGRELEITATKDFAMVQLWDDRAISVEMNTGYRTSRSAALVNYADANDPLGHVEEGELMDRAEDALIKFELSLRPESLHPDKCTEWK